MESLPVEILHEILQYATNLKEKCLISRKIYFVCCKILWKRFEFSAEHWGKIASTNKKSLGHIQELILKNSYKVEPMNGFSKLISNCSNVTRLLVSSPVLNDDDLWIISKYCKSLQEIRLHSIWKDFGKITDQGIQVLCETSLSKIFIKVDHAGRRRQEILISGRGLEYLSKRHLKGFGFQLVNETETFQELKDFFQSLGSFLRELKSLQDLELDWVVYDMDNVVQIAAENLVNLKRLKLGCTKKPITLFTLLGRNKDISALELCEMAFKPLDSQELYSALLPNGQNVCLKELKLDGLGFLSSLLPKKDYFPNLEKLVIVPSTNVASILSNATDDDISQIISTMTRLKSLIIPITTDDPLFVLSKICVDLEELDVIDGRNITDEGLLSLTKLCHLKRIALGSASHVTKDGIFGILQNLGVNLTRISLPFNNPNIQADIIPIIRDYCPKLEAITNLPAQITFDELKDFVKEMKALFILGRCIGGSRAFSPLGYLNKLQIELIKKNSKRLAYVIQNG